METFPGYRARQYAGRADLAGMVDVINAARRGAGEDDIATVEEMSQQYEHLQRCDPATDILVVEDADSIVGYARTVWDDVGEGYRAYWAVVENHPDHPGIETMLFDWVEGRATEIADGHPDGEKRLGAWSNTANPRADLLVARGYKPVRYGADMVRPHFDDIPGRTLPDGVETRPVSESHLRAIWEADVEAFRDHRGYVEPTETDWEAWLDSPHWDPSLWQVAWAGDEVVGQVRNFINHEENDTFNKLRGWTENISTARAYRGQGIAGALICSSLHLLKERGMTEAALGVDTENPTGALHLYESLGFVRTALFAEYEKPV